MPRRRVLQQVVQRLIRFQEDIVDLVFIQDLERMLEGRGFEEVLKHTVVYEDVGASVNKRLELGGGPLHVPSPLVLAKDPSVQVLLLHRRQRSAGEFFIDLLLKLSRRR